LTVENFGAGFISTPDGKPIHCISQNGVLFQVIEETIGQGSGAKDSTGTEIYENDILQYRFPEGIPPQIGYVSFFASMFVVNFDDQSDLTLGFMLTDEMTIIGQKFE
jgi:hypothetical protein